MSKETQEVRIIKTSKKTMDFDPRYWLVFATIVIILLLMLLLAVVFPYPTPIQQKLFDVLLYGLIICISFVCGGKMLASKDGSSSERRDLPETQVPPILPPPSLPSPTYEELSPAPQPEQKNQLPRGN